MPLLSSLLNTVSFIVNHPLTVDNRSGAVGRFLRWQIASRLLKSYFVNDFVENSKILCCHGMKGATGNIYVGSLEFSEMAFLLHLIRDNDLFVDVGANIGAYSILASRVRGAQSIAVEPASSTINVLTLNIAVNSINERVTVVPCALSDTERTGYITSDLDTVNKLLCTNESVKNREQVNIRTLDSVVGESSPILVKIDVEGHEHSVLSGATRMLSRPAPFALIIEPNDDQVPGFLGRYGFSRYYYDPFKRSLDPIESSPNRYGQSNDLYIRNLEEVMARCAAAPPFTVLNQCI